MLRRIEAPYEMDSIRQDRVTLMSYDVSQQTPALVVTICELRQTGDAARPVWL